MRLWYEFWIVFYNDMIEKDTCEHGILNGTSLGDVTEQLTNIAEQYILHQNKNFQ